MSEAGFVLGSNQETPDRGLSNRGDATIRVAVLLARERELSQQKNGNRP